MTRMSEVAAVGPLGWWHEAGGERYVSYRGTLNGSKLRLHYGFDGWREPIREVRLESAGPDLAVAQVPELEAHLVLDCAVTDGERWDNNGGVNYRLWTGFNALDAHMHLSGRGAGALGAHSLATAMASAGMACGISSWLDNRSIRSIARRRGSFRWYGCGPAAPNLTKCAGAWRQAR
jgi:hypothetical protein